MHNAAQYRSDLRRDILAIRAGRDKTLASRQSLQAQNILLRSASWQNAHFIALYMPIRGETDTSLLVKAALDGGKTLYLPKMLDKTRLVFAKCADPRLLEAGIYGIPEPPYGDMAEKLDLVIVPGVAFDKRGYRLGYGAGCYDRALAQPNASRATFIGLCFKFQTVQDISPQFWDIPMHGICTEEGLS